MTFNISGGMNNFGWDTLSVNKQFIKSKKLNDAFLVLFYKSLNVSLFL